GLFLVLRPGPQKGHAQAPNKVPSPLDQWNKPDLVLIVSGQMYGYIQPCGCSSPQFGGLARRFNFLQSLKDQRWPVVSVGLGDITQRSGPQALLKYVYSMKALQAMSYGGIGIGKNEFNIPLIEALGNYTLQEEKNSVPILAANLADRQKVFHDMVKPWRVVNQ